MKPILLFLMFSLVIFSCKEDEPESALKGCCGNDALNEDIGNGHIYVPNIFTPNDDGINDRLFIATDSIQLIIEVEIRDSKGNKVFEAFEPAINKEEDTWDGKVNGLVVEGLYSVTVSVLAEDGTSRIVEGKVCNFPCNGDQEVTERIPGENCQFPVQSDSGHFCPTCPSGEPNDCYE